MGGWPQRPLSWGVWKRNANEKKHPRFGRDPGERAPSIEAAFPSTHWSVPNPPGAADCVRNRALHKFFFGAPKGLRPIEWRSAQPAVWVGGEASRRRGRATRQTHITVHTGAVAFFASRSRSKGLEINQRQQAVRSNRHPLRGWGDTKTTVSATCATS